MTIIARTDGLGWDVVIPAANGTTVRSIIKTAEGFVVVNGFKDPTTSITRSTFRQAIRTARNNEV